jgi:hypothetical protein
MSAGTDALHEFVDMRVRRHLDMTGLRPSAISQICGYLSRARIAASEGRLRDVVQWISLAETRLGMERSFDAGGGGDDDPDEEADVE